MKVRLADKGYPGLGVEVPAGDDCVLKVAGLRPRQEYVFAVAAYTGSGELVGGSIGQTGRPVLAAFSLPLLFAWGQCCEVGLDTCLTGSASTGPSTSPAVCIPSWLWHSGKEIGSGVVETLCHRGGRTTGE